MGGIQVGTRLERLRKLRDAVDLQIKVEERAQAQSLTPPTSVPVAHTFSGFMTVPDALHQLGVTSAEVRRWAREQGLDVGVRGMPGLSVVDAYAAAHQPPNGTL